MQSNSNDIRTGGPRGNTFGSDRRRVRLTPDQQLPGQLAGRCASCSHRTNRVAPGTLLSVCAYHGGVLPEGETEGSSYRSNSIAPTESAASYARRVTQ